MWSNKVTATTNPNPERRSDVDSPLWVIAKAKRGLEGAAPWLVALPLLSAWLGHVDWNVTAAAVTVVWGFLALITTVVALYGLFSLGSAIADEQQLPRDDARFALLMRFLPIGVIFGVLVLVYGLLIAPWLMRLLLAAMAST
jgi:hypothetical protein